MGRESVRERVPEVGPSQLGKRCQLGLGWLLSAFVGGFGWGKNVFRVNYTDKNSFHLLDDNWGVGWDGCRRAALDDVFYK
jgi:hypothetical protein